MKNRQGILAALLALALLIGNALLLPKLLAYAQALPAGEVVTQQPVDSTERVPLPEPPEGFGEPYELKFSRELTAGEQRMWDGLEQEMKQSDDLRSGLPMAEVFYTERAQEVLIASVAQDFRPDYLEEFSQSHRVGDGAPGTILLDLGSVTLCIGDEPLTREDALPLMRKVLPWGEHGEYKSYVDQNYDDIYFGFIWMQPQKNSQYTLSRRLCPGEQPRHMRLMTDYMLRGLRPGTPLATSDTPDGTLWFDEQTSTIHLPMRYEMTDDEMLHYIELIDTLTRQALLIQTPDMITEQQAVGIAKEWAAKLFGRDMNTLSVFATPMDEDFFESEDYKPLWRIRFGPEDMLLRWDDKIERFEIRLNAKDGTLDSASCAHSPDLAPLTDKTVKQVRADLKQKAIEIVQTLFEDGRKPQKAFINSYNFWGGNKDSHNLDVDMSYEVSYVVSMANGVEYELGFTTGDYALIYYRYWPDGCENMG